MLKKVWSVVWMMSFFLPNIAYGSQPVCMPSAADYLKRSEVVAVAKPKSITQFSKGNAKYLRGEYTVENAIRGEPVNIVVVERRCVISEEQSPEAPPIGQRPHVLSQRPHGECPRVDSVWTLPGFKPASGQDSDDKRQFGVSKKPVALYLGSQRKSKFDDKAVYTDATYGHFYECEGFPAGSDSQPIEDLGVWLVDMEKKYPLAKDMKGTNEDKLKVADDESADSTHEKARNASKKDPKAEAHAAPPQTSSKSSGCSTIGRLR